MATEFPNGRVELHRQGRGERSHPALPWHRDRYCSHKGRSSRFVAVLSYSPFSAKENSALTALKARWFTKLRLRSPLRKAQKAKAGAVVGPTQVITRTAARQAYDNGVAVVLFTPNTREDLYKFCTWPVDMLITDYPNLGQCP